MESFSTIGRTHGNFVTFGNRAVLSLAKVLVGSSGPGVAHHWLTLWKIGACVLKGVSAWLKYLRQLFQTHPLSSVETRTLNE